MWGSVNMKFDRTLIGALLLGMLALASSAYGISISVSNNAGGFTENINAGDGDSVFGRTVIGSDSLSNSIEGSGSLKESHSVSNKAGANAGVSVDIRNAERYSYDYDLSPDKASKSAPVMAGEELDVLNAEYIEANAQAFNAKGYTADVSTVIHDPGNQASLIGYRNIAMASRDEAMASQIAEGAFGPNGYIQADSLAGFTQLKSKPLQFREDAADASIRVDRGSVEGYSDLASASVQGIMASQQVDAATGEQIRTRSEAASRTASLFQSLKTANAKVNTRAEGTLAGYNASAESSQDYAQADQSGHIVGTFTSTALAGKASKTRTSNYGDKYDLNMQARKDASGSYATGALGYYVDNVSPIANRIQGAVDAAESDDDINVLPGTYFENVAIDKSLDILGAGASETVVDGNRAGSVFKIGETNSNIDVTLSGMTITGGSGTVGMVDPELFVYLGGGIYNKGRVTIRNCLIHGNLAAYYGGGVWSKGTATIIGSNISGNEAGDGGGVYSDGTVTITGSNISSNVAAVGGGVYSDGTVTITDSTISRNSAIYNSGGVWSDGTAMIANSTISENLAGGVHNYGVATITDSTISGNLARFGGYGDGGVYNEGTATITGSTISGNSAVYGGGISNAGTAATITITNSTISGNVAKQWGGGVYNDGTAKITNSTISGNSADWDGGGVYNNLLWWGGQSIVNISENSTITQNIADSDNDGVGTGGGIYWSGSTLNFIDANGDGIVDPSTIVFDNHLGNGDVNNIEPPL